LLPSLQLATGNRRCYVAFVLPKPLASKNIFGSDSS
jgi:hypothetical protein